MQAVSEPRRHVLVTAGITGLSVLLGTVTGGLFVGPVGPPVDPVVGLAVPVSLVFGLPGILGVTLGVVLSGVLRSSLSLLLLVDAGTVLVLGYLGYRLWGVLPAVATGQAPGLDSPGQIGEFLAVCLLATTTAVSVLAWGRVLVHAQLFHGVAFTEFPIVFVSTVGTGVVLLLAGQRVPDGYTPSYSDRTPIARGTGGFWGAVVAPICWLLTGTLVSIAAALVQSVGETTLAQHGYGFVFVPFDPALVGVGARRVQVVFGAMMGALVLATWLGSNRNTQPDWLPIGS